MAFTLGAKSSGGMIASNGLTVSHTTSSGERLLTASIICRDGATITGAAYNGIPLTKAVGYAHPTDLEPTEVWYLIDPPVGTFNLVITLSASILHGVSVATWACTALPSLVATGQNSNSGTLSNPSATLGAGTGTLAVDAVSSEAPNSPPFASAGADQTILHNFGNGTFGMGASYDLAPSSGEVFNWTHTGGTQTDTWCHVVALFIDGTAPVLPEPVGTPAAAVFSATSVVTPTTLTPGTGTGYAVGDVLLCFTACRSATPTVATPAGWTLLLNMTGTNGRFALFGKVAASTSEAAPSVVWSGLTTGNSGTPCGARVQAFKNLSLTVDVQSLIENGAASTTVSASGPSVTLLSAKDLVLCLSSRLDDAGTWSAPAGMTMINSNGTTSGSDFAFGWAYRVDPPTGSFAPADFGLAGASSFASIGAVIALKVIPTGPATLFGATSLPMSFNSVVAGSRKTFSSLVRPFTFQASVAGSRKAFGQVIFPLIFSKEVNGQRKAFGQLALPLVFAKQVAAQRKTFGQVVFPINVGITTAGFRPGLTYFGAVSFPITFGKDVSGRRKAFGQVIFPITFNKDVIGQRKTFGQLLSPFIFGKDVRGQRKTFGQTALPINIVIATAGIRLGVTRYGVVDFPVIFGKDVRGQRKTFSQLAMPMTFSKAVAARRTTFGQIVFPIIFTKEAVGHKEVFGQLSMQTLFGKETAGRRQTFSQFALPVIFSKNVAGRKQTFGRVLFPINVAIFTTGHGWQGAQTHFGQLAMPLTFSKQVAGRRKTFGQISSPLLFGTASQGWRRTFTELELPIDFETEVKSGPVGTYGLVDLDLLLTMNTAGLIKLFGVILNDALELHLGEQDILAAYVGSEQVWP
jgi:hypothetical protein